MSSSTLCGPAGFLIMPIKNTYLRINIRKQLSSNLDHRRFDIFMSQKLLNLSDIEALRSKLRRIFDSLILYPCNARYDQCAKEPAGHAYPEAERSGLKICKRRGNIILSVHMFFRQGSQQ